MTLVASINDKTAIRKQRYKIKNKDNNILKLFIL